MTTLVNNFFLAHQQLQRLARGEMLEREDECQPLPPSPSKFLKHGKGKQAKRVVMQRATALDSHDVDAVAFLVGMKHRRNTKEVRRAIRKQKENVTRRLMQEAQPALVKAFVPICVQENYSSPPNSQPSSPVPMEPVVAYPVPSSVSVRAIVVRSKNSKETAKRFNSSA